MKNIVELFENEATELGYLFIYGARAFINYEVSIKDMRMGEIIVALFPLIDQATSIVNGSFVSRFSTSTTIWFGLKFDNDYLSGTLSDVDETNRQKYDRRLFDLKKKLLAYVQTVICGELELTNFRMSEAINQTDENIDFIGCDITFLHDIGYEDD